MRSLRLTGETQAAQTMNGRRVMNKPLTERQLEIITLLAEGASDYEIKSRLDIAGRTLRWHLARINDRLGTRTRPQMVAVALRQGLLPCPSPCPEGCRLCSAQGDSQRP